MTLEQLRIFVAVARCEHVTRAAGDLNLTQSAVSAAVTALERRHGVKLFNRVGRGVELTPEGRLFQKEAEAVLLRAGEAEQVLNDLVRQPGGLLRLAASQTVASYWLPSRMMAFHEYYPEVALELTAGNTETVVADVRQGTVDLGVVEGEVAGDDLDVLDVAGDRISVVVGARHDWRHGQKVGAEELAATSWIMRERGSGTRAEFERRIAERGVDPGALDVVLELPSNEACLAAVEGSLSATVLSRRAAQARLGYGLWEAGFDLPRRRFRAIRDPRRYLSRAARAMLEMLKG
ncbi:LysR substrate-binding domain-containing protein [Frigidibacter sp. ROC022]|uniref:LysR substrate-binding domain-containing protein n=1 Tax=Frigidibacter sp. ROC022 TaxID=2971796 RepID=UPI00215A60B3|nr:LysR substrate-binding domain-containing protein [Frigidibacter sp. ROC022]MCR8725298.1 LysR substrate-binding domain-containing protein [Frigidibacter sp. ROC022]